MGVPTSIVDLSTTFASNSPAGNDAVGTSLDEYLRAIQGILKQTQAQGTTIASANSITIPNDGQFFSVTGTTTIGSIANSWLGRIVYLQFASSNCQISHWNPGLLVAGGASWYTTAGDILVLQYVASGSWKVLGIYRAAGHPYTMAFNLPVGADQEYEIDLDVQQPGWLNRIAHKTRSGTITAAIRVNGSAVFSVNITSTRALATPGTIPWVAVGDRVSVLFSSNSSAIDVDIKLKIAGP